MRKTESFCVKGKVDRVLVVCVALLSISGLFAVYSATRTFGSYTNIIVQSGAVALGFALMLAFAFSDYELLKAFAGYIFAGYIFTLVLVLVAGITGIWGSKSWIKICGINIQPSELAKFGFIITFSCHLTKIKDGINRMSVLIGLIIHLLIPVSLILLQPDFGTGAVFAVIFAAMLFVAKLSPKIFVPVIGACVGALPVIYKFLSGYQQNRIRVFLNPGLDPTGGGYNVIQSKTALGAGGFLGNGYLQGIATQNGYLPAKHTDFIFSSLSEEFGFLGSVLVTALLFVIIVRIINIAGKANTLFGRYICTGVAAMLFFHVVENIGMCMGLMPVTGIPLPFVSYGGTAIITNFISVGAVLSVARENNNIFECKQRKE
ncbi:MAG: rod shape-determining protein RodA [Clostridia bacterium]|nr:rod shape-determining protein RodA [Clostridia bacterium]